MKVRKISVPVALAAMAFLTAASATMAANDDQVARGKYLVSVIGCNDCHTPGALTGKPQMDKFLGGSDVGFEIPGLGVFVGANLTPDDETGLGKWSVDEIVTAFTTGKTPSGRELAPVMPYMNFANLTHDDAVAIAEYLKTIPAIKHKVPGPFGPNDKVTVLVERVVPGSGMAQK